MPKDKKVSNILNNLSSITSVTNHTKAECKKLRNVLET